MLKYKYMEVKNCSLLISVNLYGGGVSGSIKFLIFQNITNSTNQIQNITPDYSEKLTQTHMLSAVLLASIWSNECYNEEALVWTE